MERTVSNSSKSQESAPTRRNALWLGLGALAVAGGGSAIYMLNGESIGSTPAIAADDNSKDMKINTETDNIMGSADAPVTIVEYSSLTCPHCANFHQMTVPGMKEKYVKTGKVRYIIREFPLDQLAFAAAAIARCADKEKFFPFVTALYKSQSNWAKGDGSAAQKLFDMAKQVGFTQEKFNACLGNKEVIEHISESRRQGSEDFGVNATPTIFINGKKLEGGNSLADIEKAMEPYLKG